MDSFDQLIIQVEDSGMKTSNALVFLSLLWVHLTVASSHERTLSASVDSSNAAATLGQKVAFLAYTAKYGKNYASTSEFNSRFKQWVQTDNYIKSFTNSQMVLSHNKFSDWFESEKNGVLNSKLGQATVASASLAQQKTTDAAVDCAAGQYKIAGSSSCGACPAGCATCTSATVCTTCRSDKFQLNRITNLCVCTTGPILASGTDCQVCAQNQYYDQTALQCINCNKNIAQCATCNSATSCLTCSNNFLQQNGFCVCPNLFNTSSVTATPTVNNSFIDITGKCVQCNANQFFNLNTNPTTDSGASKCLDCPQNCTVCAFAPFTSTNAKLKARAQPVAGLPANCTACQDTYLLNSTTGGCTCPANSYVDPVTKKCITLVECPQKFYNLNNTCKPCGAYCLQCAPQTGICTKCQENLVVVADGAQNCPTCDPIFQFIQPGQCRCPATQFIDRTGKCVNKASCSLGNFVTGASNFTSIDGTAVFAQNTCISCALASNQYCKRCDDTTGQCKEAVHPSFLIDPLNQNGAPYCASNKVLSDNTLVPPATKSCLDWVVCGKTPSGRSQYNDGKNTCKECPFGCEKCDDITRKCTQCSTSYTVTTLPDQSVTCSCLNSQNVNKEFYNAATDRCVALTPCGINKYNNGFNTCLVHPDIYCDVVSPLWNNDPATGGKCLQCMQTFDFWGGSTCRCNPNPQIQFIGPNTINNILGQSKQCVNIIPCNATSWNDGYNNCYNCSDSTRTLYCNQCAFGTGKCSGCQNNFFFDNSVSPAKCNKNANSWISYDPWAQVRDISKDYWVSNSYGCTACNDGLGDCSACVNNLQLIQNDNRTVTCGCLDGTYLDAATMQCRNCPDNCTTCNSDQQCTSCVGYFGVSSNNAGLASGFTLFSDGTCGCDINSVWIAGQCEPLQTCGVGYFADLNNECQVCPIQYCNDCAQVTGACLQCIDTPGLDMQPSEDGMSCSCPAGTFLDLKFGADNPMCVPCWWSSGDNMSYCYTCDDDRTCTSCLGVGFNLNNGCQCDAGKYQVLEYQGTNIVTTAAFGDSKQIYDCIPCPDNCTQCDQFTGKCTQCQQSFILDTVNSVCNCQDSGQSTPAAIINGMCSQWIPCSDSVSNYLYPTNIFYNDGANNCFKCPKFACKCDDFTGLVNTDNCMPGMTWDSTTNTCGCAKNQYLVKTTDNAKKCANSPADSQTHFTCAACPDFSLTCSDYTGYAQTCLPGFVNVGGKCICNTGPVGRMFFTAAAGGNAAKCEPIKKCPLGQSNDGVNNQCVNCGAFCMKCKDYTGECTLCNSTFQFVSGQNPQYSCECPKGKYSQNKGPCQACAQNCTACKNDYNSFGCTECKFTGTTTKYADFYNNQTCVCHPQEQAVTPDGCKPLFANCGAPDVNSPTSPATNDAVKYTGNQFYDDGTNTCKKCPGAYALKCNQYLGQTTDCLATFTKFGTAVGNYICNCNPGQYKSFDKNTGIYSCQTCAQNCTLCDDWTGNCNTCKNTFSLGVYDPVRCACPFATPAWRNYAGADGLCHPLFDGCDKVTKKPFGWYDEFVAFTGTNSSQSPLTGFYDPWNNICTPCPDFANKCVNQTLTPLVVQCNSVTFWQKPTSCVCGTNHFTALQKCNQCPNFCASCSSADVCISCLDTFTLNDKTKKCECLSTQALQDRKCQVWQTCKSGFYNPGNNLCTPCPANCATCADRTGICSACLKSDSSVQKNAVPFTLTLSANTCTCSDKSYDNTKGLCLTCPRNCEKCTYGTGQCTQCTTGFEKQADGSCECARNQYQTQGVCGDATVCKDGTYNLGNNVCQQCPGNCTTCANLTGSCTSCIASDIYKFKLLTKTDGLVGCIPQNCPVGTFPTSLGDCQTCPGNCTTCDDITGSCKTCADTFSLDSSKTLKTCGCLATQNLIPNPAKAGKPECTAFAICKIGWYSDTQNNCQKCPQNSTTCSSPFGKATTCAFSFELNYDTGVCQCNQTQSMIVKEGINQCVPLGRCNASYYNLGNDKCAQCSPNCLTCKPYTGDCQQCASTFKLDLTTLKCVSSNRLLESNKECQYQVGPVGNQTICLSKPASSTRLVPSFDDSSSNVDWRKWQVIGGVKDQGRCGGGYAFASAAAAESAYAIKTGNLHDLSEQYLIDCDSQSQGCQGGQPYSSSLLLSTSGAVLESDYPYTGKQSTCHGSSATKVFQLAYPGSQQIERGKGAFKAALRQGPLSVSFRVSGNAFFFYGSGIMPASMCASGSVNHAMLAVGYGVEQGVEYALIQNQWGQGWGEQGLIRVELTNDQTGPCGLYTQNTYSLV